MRILLVGEYSRIHNSLKEGLIELGHEVTLIGDKDFKGYPVDISVYAKVLKENYFLNKIRQVIYRLFDLDIAQIENAVRFYFVRKKVINYDIVQLVNEYPIQSTLFFEKKIVNYIFKNNKNVFLSSCGDDFICVNYMLNGGFSYSVLTPCETNPKLGHCKFTLAFAKKEFYELHKLVFENIKAVIPADMDYAIPLRNHPKALPLIPNPINLIKNKFSPLVIEDKIIIFHGINEVNYYKKGNGFFEKALEIISLKYRNKVEVITTRSIPYDTYIKLYDSCHILMDQVYGYDQGYNALEAMAKGKVVFTGAEKEFMEHYNLKERVCVNALPDVDSLVKELCYLIENPTELIAMGKRARAFIEKEHDYVAVAGKYLENWKIKANT